MEPPGHGSSFLVGQSQPQQDAASLARPSTARTNSNKNNKNKKKNETPAAAARREPSVVSAGGESSGGASDPSFFRPGVPPPVLVKQAPPPPVLVAAPAKTAARARTNKDKKPISPVQSSPAQQRPAPASGSSPVPAARRSAPAPASSPVPAARRPAPAPTAAAARAVPYQVPYDDEEPPEQARPSTRGEFGVKESIRDLYQTPAALTGRDPQYAYPAQEQNDYVESSFVLMDDDNSNYRYQSFVSPTAHQDAFFTIADLDKEPTTIFPHQGTVNRVKVRTLAQNIGATGKSFVEVQHREVTFLSKGGDNDEEPELEPGSNISFASLESTLPMAFDNNRFFDVDDGYYHLLKQASDRMRELGDENVFRAPDKEMGIFGWLWRWMVRFLMYLTGSDINRLMLTRGIQANLFFSSAYEAFVLGNLIRYFDIDDRSHDGESIRGVFHNRNTSRIVVRALGPRWNWFFHLNTRVRCSRLFDMISRFPFMARYFGFPATENFPATRDHALRGLVRPIFEGSWLTRTLTNQQGVITFNPKAPAQNLAAESTGFEAGNRNQVGTYFGRKASNAFRFEHRLTTDESIIRTFISSPGTTFTNNGAEHVLRCMAKHWRNMLYQENGNFAHQRYASLGGRVRVNRSVLTHSLLVTTEWNC
jgi:hypothetical protein